MKMIELNKKLYRNLNFLDLLNTSRADRGEIMVDSS